MKKRYLSAEDFRKKAQRRMPAMIFDALDGAAGYEIAKKRNYSSFDEVCLKSRVLVDVEKRNLDINFLKKNWKLPFGIAPMGMCNLFWPNSDEIMATAASQNEFPLGVSTMSSTSLEDLFDISQGNAWFQLYAGQSDNLTKELIDKAEKIGYENLILTVDVPVLAPRRRDLRNEFGVPFKLKPKHILDFVSHPSWLASTILCGQPKPLNINKSIDTKKTNNEQFSRNLGRGRFDWRFLEELRSRWQKNLIIKGIMCIEDAKKAVEIGVDCIYVSNHGGRQLDSAPAAITVLPLIRQAIGSEFPIIFDSGIRSGEDIARALASGADFTMIGRSFLYAAAANGSNGVYDLVKFLRDDLSNVMAQIGCITPGQITADVLA